MANLVIARPNDSLLFVPAIRRDNLTANFDAYILLHLYSLYARMSGSRCYIALRRDHQLPSPSGGGNAVSSQLVVWCSV